MLVIYTKDETISYSSPPGYRKLPRYKVAAKIPRDHMSVRGRPKIISEDLREDKQT